MDVTAYKAILKEYSKHGNDTIALAKDLVMGATFSDEPQALVRLVCCLIDKAETAPEHYAEGSEAGEEEAYASINVQYNDQLPEDFDEREDYFGDNLGRLGEEWTKRGETLERIRRELEVDSDDYALMAIKSLLREALDCHDLLSAHDVIKEHSQEQVRFTLGERISMLADERDELAKRAEYVKTEMAHIAKTLGTFSGHVASLSE